MRIRSSVMWEPSGCQPIDLVMSAGPCHCITSTLRPQSSDHRNRPCTDNGAAGSRPGRGPSITIIARSIKRKWCVCLCGVELIREPVELSPPKMNYITEVWLYCGQYGKFGSQMILSDRSRPVWISTGLNSLPPHCCSIANSNRQVPVSYEWQNCY